jgi:hypothetical protein
MTIPEYKVEAALAVMFKNTIEELLTDQQAKDLRDRVRRGLEAAEAAQEPPQIEVTEGMASAGQEFLREVVYRAQTGNVDLWWSAIHMYRAMRALEKPEANIGVTRTANPSAARHRGMRDEPGTY